MRFSTKWYYLKETFKSIKRNSLMSIASISTVALSILVLGLFLVMVLNVNNIARYLENQVQVTVYMEDSANAAQRRQVEQKLKLTQGVMEVKAVTKEQALKKFKERLREQQKLLDALGEENPFPYSFEVKVDKPERIQQIVPEIENMPGVETAKFGQEVVKHIFQLTRILRLGGILLIVMLAIATLFIISNTIRITVFARRREVSIMKFVGATNWFIRWPFLLEGMIMGFIGALIASAALYEIYETVQAKIYATLAFFPLLPLWPFMGYLCACLVLVGTFIGAAGSAISLRKFLDV
ncbi:MAG: permease-like cell division protein FtsX [Acidaminococcus sp.]|jgi:cell division transport system permease protein|nr:permease-like cell division protein FtsX [Acidaminococcus sp.]MCI2100176.1 permease-like cell division protein FtsX [Acidaminococcus sp.]MCI2114495.1 permease-like cell division protein FtsX [Acidaminococcus sp.]MCI2116501.1 permease-like cell division protein FtsX [Acidaminococcus sp.]